MIRFFEYLLAAVSIWLTAIIAFSLLNDTSDIQWTALFIFFIALSLKCVKDIFVK